LVAAHDIRVGQQVSAADFETARVANDSGNVVPASAKRNFVGTFASTEIPAGTLLNRLMFQATSVVPDDGVVVGVTVGQNQRPAASIVSGDLVRAFNVPKETGSGQPVTTGDVLVSAARVVDVSGGSGSGDSITVSLLVTQDDAKILVAAASQGTVSIGMLPKTAVPVIDFQSKS
jgi:hypothetical protein